MGDCSREVAPTDKQITMPVTRSISQGFEGLQGILMKVPVMDRLKILVDAKWS
jgi:hypothetical protein